MGRNYYITSFIIGEMKEREKIDCEKGFNRERNACPSLIGKIREIEEDIVRREENEENI